MADPIRCVYAMEDGYFCTKHSNGFYDGSCRLLEGKPCEDQKPPKPITNADRIRAMSDEELADYLICDVEAEAIRRAGRFLTAGEINHAITDCLGWLRQEVSE